MNGLRYSQDMEELKFYTSSEVADILKMNPQVIARKLQFGELEGYKIGKDWRVSHAQLMRFLEKHSNANAAKTPQEKVVKSFFEGGKLKSIPTTRLKREWVLRHLVSQLEPNRVYTEKEINNFISNYHQDVCTIRREFIINKLMVRNAGKYKVATWNLTANL
jgi:excisionase family DNA binding protein